VNRFTKLLSVAYILASTNFALAQSSPYIGYVYPAGGQQGTTFQIRIGGQALDNVNGVRVTGSGVTARVVEYYQRLNFEELQVLNEQLTALKRQTMSESARAMLMKFEDTNSTLSDAPAMMASNPNNMEASTRETSNTTSTTEPTARLMDRIEKRTAEFVPTPASGAIASLVLVEVTIAPNAEPGERELRLVTLRGISNPLLFEIGQLPEVTKTPMLTASQQVLGKEAEALRKRPPEEGEREINLPCTLNGQIASGEVNRYRFEARQGQKLVFSTLGRRLVPFIADAVPGWFQPVLVLYDSKGREVAYGDRYQFRPDPIILYEVPADGEYMLAIRDNIYRGREDFVYRITSGELPFITSIFPLGGRAGTADKPSVKGWNLQDTALTGLTPDSEPGVHSLTAARKGFVSNPVPFALDTLPDVSEQEPNNTLSTAQKVSLPVIINGRIDKPDDKDVFRFEGKSNDTVVAEVLARRLDSPLDSVIKLTDANGGLIAFNDDHEDLSAGLNTHAADSYLMANLPADGSYFVHIGDTDRQGGEEYGYRLRISSPRPDFELRIAPSSLSLRSKSSGTLTVYAMRKDGFDGPIKLALKDAPAGFSNSPITLSATQTVAQIRLKTDLVATQEPVSLLVVGTATIAGREVAHEAVPAEDKMQAFLWRQLVPAKDLEVLVFDPKYQPPANRGEPARLIALARTNALAMQAASTNAVQGTNAVPKPKFTKEQVAGRLRDLKRLYEQGMFTDEFYAQKVAECETEE
jgi:hypothetical protein